MDTAYFVLSSTDLSRVPLDGRSVLAILDTGYPRAKLRTTGTRVDIILMASVVIWIAGPANRELPRSRSSILEATPWGKHLCETSSSIWCHSGRGLDARLPSNETLISAPSFM